MPKLGNEFVALGVSRQDLISSGDHHVGPCGEGDRRTIGAEGRLRMGAITNQVAEHQRQMKLAVFPGAERRADRQIDLLVAG